MIRIEDIKKRRFNAGSNIESYLLSSRARTYGNSYEMEVLETPPRLPRGESALWWKSGWSRKYRRQTTIGGKVLARLQIAEERLEKAKP